ncbi:MAG TPA: amino acid adenylation domain-containing protein, partial [Thermoanaerobaculia bacterium]|nr:amino acid adenylation domain-containing protein [Thermoanaerobaculia bacterium]
STLLVSGGQLYGGPRVAAYAAAELEAGWAVQAGESSGARQLVSCGHAGTGEVVVVEPQAHRECAPGAVGEIWISGPSVARGYWRRGEETERDFAARLAGAPERGPFLRTGDLGFLTGGELFVTGRLKDLIILRGRNHYPQDVELTAERSHRALRPGCGAAFSIEAEGEERLVVAHEVEPRSNTEEGERQEWEEIGAAVVRTVAAVHEIPVHAVVLLKPGTIPKTSSGKIRRRACREDYLARRLSTVGEWRPAEQLSRPAAEAARTPIEERLAGIWAEVFAREVGVQDGFLTLGGDSLRAAQILARIREDFGVELELDDLFAAGGVADLARFLEAEGGVARSAPLEPPPLVRRRRDRESLLSFAQRRLWFLHQLDPGNPVYNVAAAARMEGRLSVAALEAAVKEIERRHEVLRSVYAVEGSEPVQRVLPPSCRPLPVVDLGGLAEAARRREADRLRLEVARLPFDLARGPVLRALLLCERDDRNTLVLALHHIAVDGGSFGILLDELAQLYRSFAGGYPSPLPEPVLQYADYATWQRSWLQDEAALAGSLAYWRQRLSGAPPVLELPADRPRPPVMSHRGSQLESALSADLTAGLEALGHGRMATPFMVQLSGFLALLQRYTGRDDLVVGTPVDGRDRVELEPMIGAFPNTLVLRAQIERELSFADRLSRVRAMALEAYAHRHLPFEILAGELSPGRDLSRMPLVQVLFVGRSELQRLELPGLTLVPAEVETGAAQFDLSVAVAPAEAGWLATWTYSTDLFDRVTVERLARHFAALLRAAVAEPAAAIADLDLLSPAERHQVVVGWNDTRRDGVAECLHELVAAQAERSPRRVAVVDGERTLTYRELALRANRLARHLAGLGVGPESRVGVALERSAEMVVALLGVLEAGGAYVPLDPGYPRERLASLLADAGVEVLLTQSRLEERLPEGAATIIRLDPEAFAGEASGARAPAPLRQALPESPAYVIYTSGSTGRPKGVLVPHRGIVDRVLWLQETYGLQGSDRVLQKTPFSFDVSVVEIFWPLSAGARLVMAPPGAHQDPACLAGLIRDQRISMLWFVPSLLQVFLEQPGLPASCRSVQRVVATGEALSLGLQERFFERLPGIELYNLYGPTEASVEATFQVCRPAGGRPVVPIGRPLANVTARALDRDLRPVPLGVAGELCLGGVGLARGYLGRPELTAEWFVPDPLAEEPGARLYRTGDLARWQPDGAVEYLGRLDQQLKVRGFRIEPGEIESALASYPGVRESVVVVRGDEAGDRRLVAYLVPAGG